MQPTVRLASAKNHLQWDSYVLSHDAASPYHLFAWQGAVEKAYGFKACSLVASDQEKIVGILPLIHFTTPLRGGALIALPYCDVGGPLADDEMVESALLHYAARLGADLKAWSLDIRGPRHQGALPSSGFAVEEKSDKVRMLLSLPSSGEALWQSFRSKLRSQINKAQKNGLTFEFSENLHAFYGIFARNMHELGSPVHSFAWFQAIFENYGQRAKLGLVYNGRQAIGGGVLLLTDRMVSIPWASTLRASNHLSPNMLLYWKFLENSAERGFALLDFGRSTLGEGTYRFKAQWGAQPVPLVWHTVRLAGKGTTGREDQSPSERGSMAGSGQWKRALAARLWRLLPAGFVDRVGPVCRKYISL